MKFKFNWKGFLGRYKLSRDLFIITRKEFRVQFRSTFVVLFILGIPVLFVFLILSNILTIISDPAVGLEDVGKLALRLSSGAGLENLVPGYEHMAVKEVYIRYYIMNSLGIFLVMPSFIPSFLSALSVTAEKRSGTLESVLCTPVSTTDLLVGKTISSIIPSVLSTWASFLILCVGVTYLTYPSYEVFLMPNTVWLIAIFVITPLIAFVSVLWQLLASALFEDPGVSMIIIMAINPGVFLYGVVSSDMIPLTTEMMTAITIALGVVLVLLAASNVFFFNREEILT
jgi:ABC-type Na+ efflux pump permease subunit